MGKKSKKFSIFKYVVLGAVLLGAYGYVLFSNKQLKGQMEAVRAEMVSVKADNDRVFAYYPSQNQVTDALDAEKKYLPDDYELAMKRVADSILTLVAKDASLKEALDGGVAAFNENDHMRCFWYRWGHKDVLGLKYTNKQFFPYTTLDSLSCVMLYPIIFKD